MRIGILGTRGIPNRYGGFEQFAEYLSKYLLMDGHSVAVYNSSTHPYKESNFNGVDIIHIFDPEDQVGTIGQFIYDLLCILDSRNRNFDVILQLGYTSSSIWGWIMPKNAVIITNMDGLEWKRTKYSKIVQMFLQYAERLAVQNSDYLVADSIGIRLYLNSKYKIDSTYIAYGADVVTQFEESILETFALNKDNYSMLIARLEPENSIEEILDGVILSGLNSTFLVIGKYSSKYGVYLRNKYASYSYIKFLGAIFDIEILNNLRRFAKFYFHGHTVGGTNPSLLEAMASKAMICAHNNVFNKSILGDDALYFENASDVADIMCRLESNNVDTIRCNNIAKIEQLYSWKNITNQYIKLFNSVRY